MSETAIVKDEVLEALTSALRALKRNATTLATTTTIGGLLFVLFALVSSPYYTATTTLVASSAVAQGGQGANSALNTLAGLAGTTGGTRELSPFERLQLVLKSTGLAKSVLNDERAREILFPGRWDATAHTWVEPSGLLVSIRSILGRNESIEPDSVTATSVLASHLGINVDTATSSMHLTFTDSDRDAALYMLRLVLQQADDTVRRDYLMVAQGYTDYILKLLPSVDNVVSRSALTEQMSRYQETVVMAHVNLPFAELAIDPPNVPAKRSGPKPVLYLLFGLLAGFLGGIACIVVRPWLFSRLGRVVALFWRPKADASSEGATW